MYKYKIIIKYYGVLCDKEQLDDEEVFDEDVMCFTDDIEVIKNEIEHKIKEWIKRGYILDFQQDKNVIRLFNGIQENWNDYLEIYYVENDKVQDFYIYKLYKFGYIETIIYEIERTILKLKNEVVNNGMKNNTILELALLIELKRFLDDPMFLRNSLIEDVKLMCEYKGELIDSVVNSYFNTSLGISFDDLRIMVNNFLKDYKKD